MPVAGRERAWVWPTKHSFLPSLVRVARSAVGLRSTEQSVWDARKECRIVLSPLWCSQTAPSRPAPLRHYGVFTTHKHTKPPAASHPAAASKECRAGRAGPTWTECAREQEVPKAGTRVRDYFVEFSHCDRTISRSDLPPLYGPPSPTVHRPPLRPGPLYKGSFRCPTPCARWTASDC